VGGDKLSERKEEKERRREIESMRKTETEGVNKLERTEDGRVCDKKCKLETERKW
jgi:hypothetical protein